MWDHGSKALLPNTCSPCSQARAWRMGTMPSLKDRNVHAIQTSICSVHSIATQRPKRIPQQTCRMIEQVRLLPHTSTKDSIFFLWLSPCLSFPEGPEMGRYNPVHVDYDYMTHIHLLAINHQVLWLSNHIHSITEYLPVFSLHLSYVRVNMVKYRLPSTSARNPSHPESGWLRGRFVPVSQHCLWQIQFKETHRFLLWSVHLFVSSYYFTSDPSNSR